MVDSSKTPRFLVHPLSACKQASRRQTVTWWGTTGHAASLVPLNCKLVKMSARKQAVALAHNAVPPDHRGFVLYLWTYEKKLYWYALDTGRNYISASYCTIWFVSFILGKNLKWSCSVKRCKRSDNQLSCTCSVAPCFNFFFLSSKSWLAETCPDLLVCLHCLSSSSTNAVKKNYPWCTFVFEMEITCR